ncbi:MAG: hypothetical protein J7D61_07825 [Marichromatium sp.]|nr:hypothetical protein [Marichromatium sp.]
MATQVRDVATAWVQVVVGFSSDFLVSLYSGGKVVARTTDTADPPIGWEGHIITSRSNGGLTRDLVGPGYVWVRALSRGAPAVVAVTEWG